MPSALLISIIIIRGVGNFWQKTVNLNFDRTHTLNVSASDNVSNFTCLQ